MNTPAAALAWELWWQHRWGLAAVGASVALFAVLANAGPFTPTDAGVSSIWFAMGLCYVIGLFAYGTEARLDAAESGFPARLFVLPVRTWVLVGWPMLQGVAVAVGLWLAWDGLVLRPSGVETPGWWAAVLAAAVAVSQALVWLPFGLPWARLVVMVFVLTVLVRAPAALSLFGERYTGPEAERTVLPAAAAGLIPAAFLMAAAGVARARRGEGWVRSQVGGTGDPPVEPRPAGRRSHQPFRSALRAQTWYEWRLGGRGYVRTVAVVVGAVLALALLDRPSARADYAVVCLFLPLVIAGFWGAMMGSPGETVRSTALTAFAATRPLDNATLVVAKARAAGLAAAAAWVFTLAAAAAWLAAVGGFGKMARLWEALTERHGPEMAVGFLTLFAAVLVLGTARALAANLWVGLAGRAWLVPAYTMVMTVTVISLLLEWVAWDADPVRSEQMRVWIPRVAVGLVAGKLLAAAGLLWIGVKRGQLSAKGAGKLLAAWVLAAAALTGGLAAVVPEGLVRPSRLAFAVVLLLPLARPAAAPLALAWNRHR
jgi:hypothetical protein